MSSIQGTTQSSRTPLVFDLDEQKKKDAANPLDVDGDGVIDGESLAGSEGKVENASLINLMLKSQGLTQSVDGNLDSVDGFTLDGISAPIAMTFDGIPPLPEDYAGANVAALGSGAGGASSTAHFDWLHDDTISGAALMWMELSTMAESSMAEMSDWKELKNAMQEGKAESKKNEIKSTEEKIEAERAAALEGFVWSAVAAIAAFAAGPANGGNQGMSQAVSTMVNKFGEYHSKAHGGQREADEKELEVMRHQLMQELMDQGIETAKSGYDEAREQFKLALKILDEHSERETQINANLTRA